MNFGSGVDGGLPVPPAWQDQRKLIAVADRHRLLIACHFDPDATVSELFQHGRERGGCDDNLPPACDFSRNGVTVYAVVVVLVVPLLVLLAFVRVRGLPSIRRNRDSVLTNGVPPT